MEKTFTESRRRQLHCHGTDHRRDRSFYPSLKFDHVLCDQAITAGGLLLARFHRTVCHRLQCVEVVDINAVQPVHVRIDIPGYRHVDHEQWTIASVSEDRSNLFDGNNCARSQPEGHEHIHIRKLSLPSFELHASPPPSLPPPLPPFPPP